MKFTYMEFSQQKLVEYGLDVVDAEILRYFIDLKDSGEMVIDIVDNQPYHWIKYDRQMPKSQEVTKEKKTDFHNFERRTDKYTPEELEKMVLKRN